MGFILAELLARVLTRQVIAAAAVVLRDEAHAVGMHLYLVGSNPGIEEQPHLFADADF